MPDVFNLLLPRPHEIEKNHTQTFGQLAVTFSCCRHGGYSVGTAYGARFLFDWRHWLGKKVALQLYEHDQITYLTSMLGRIKPEIFIDIGAHVGLYSIILKTRYPHLEVHAFEPDRANLCQLYSNLSSTNFRTALKCTNSAYRIRLARPLSIHQVEPAAVGHAVFPALAILRLT